MKKIRPLVVLGLILFLIAVSLEFAPSQKHAVLASAVILFSVLPAVLYFRAGSRSAIPFFESSCIYYAVFFGAPVFSAGLFWSDQQLHLLGRLDTVLFYQYAFNGLDAAFSLEALIYTFLSIGAYIATFYSFRYLLYRFFPNAGDKGSKFEKEQLISMAWGALALHFAYHFIPFFQTLPSIKQLLHPMGFLGLGLFIYLAMTRKISLYQSIIVLGILYPLVLLKILSHGSLSQILFYLVIVFLALFYVRRKIPWKILIIAGVFILVGYDTVFMFRGMTWTTLSHIQNDDSPIYSHYNVAQKAGLFWAIILKRITGYSPVDIPEVSINIPKNKTGDPNKRRWRHRFAHITLLSGTMEQTPANFPYWKGDSYRPLVGALVPRFFWPDKPKENFAGTYGVRYWGTHQSTSVNIPWLVELYGNFGRLGMIFGMIFFGAAFAFFDRVLNTRNGAPAKAMIGVVILFPWVYPESNFSVMVGTTPLLLLCLFSYVFLVKKSVNILATRYNKSRVVDHI